MSRTLLWVGGAAALAAVAWAGLTLWHAGSTLTAVRNEITKETAFPVAVRPWTENVPAGFESVGAPAEYTDAQPFQDNLYIAGPRGLAAYTSDGALRKRYRTGIELPPAPITATATGLAGDSPAPELWIATAGEGLVAFDGQTFRQIRPERPEQAKLTALLSTSTGRLLLGTEKSGVLSWDGSHLTQFHASLSRQWITALAGTDADLWVGTLDGGLLHWQGGSLQPVGGAMPDARVLSLASANGHIYAGTALGVADVQDNAVRRVLAPGYFAQTLAVEGQKLSIGTLEEGTVTVSLAAGSKRLQADRSRDCTSCNIRKLFRYGDDLFTLTADSLLRGGEGVLSPDAAPLKNRNISALARDAAGRLWIGYFDRGLQILGPSGERVADWEDDRLFCVNRIVHHPDQKITAVATANGLILMDGAGARRRVLTQADGLIAGQITDVAFRKDGTLIAATPAGVSFLDAGGVQSIYAFQGLVNNHVFALAADGDRVLAGTLGGLSILESGSVKASYTTANSSLKHNWIAALQKVGRETFVGTYGAGVMRLGETGLWESFDDLPRDLEINTNAMAVSADAVYAGTLDRGLAIFHRRKERWSIFSAGLPSRNVTAVEVRGGMLWIGTDNGLVRVPEASILE